MEIKPEENIVKRYQHKRTLLWIICAAVILISGIVIGAGGTILLAKHRLISIGHRHKDAAEISKEMRKRYGLTEEQTTQVETLLTNVFEKIRLQREERDKQREQTTQLLIADMNTILTPQQFQQWNKDFQELRERTRKPPKK